MKMQCAWERFSREMDIYEGEIYAKRMFMDS